MILDKTLKRIRQIIAVIAEDQAAKTKENRILVSWQTRSLAMVMAAAGGNANEDIMKFAANLTIDNEEYEEFNNEKITTVKSNSKIPVHASTQETESQKNFEAAADSNSFEAFGMFGFALENGKPGHD